MTVRPSRQIDPLSPAGRLLIALYASRNGGQAPGRSVATEAAERELARRRMVERSGGRLTLTESGARVAAKLTPATGGPQGARVAGVGRVA